MIAPKVITRSWNRICGVMKANNKDFDEIFRIRFLNAPTIPKKSNGWFRTNDFRKKRLPCPQFTFEIRWSPLNQRFADPVVLEISDDL